MYQPVSQIWGNRKSFFRYCHVAVGSHFQTYGGPPSHPTRCWFGCLGASLRVRPRRPRQRNKQQRQKYQAKATLIITTLNSRQQVENHYEQRLDLHPPTSLLTKIKGNGDWMSRDGLSPKDRSGQVRSDRREREREREREKTD